MRNLLKDKASGSFILFTILLFMVNCGNLISSAIATFVYGDISMNLFFGTSLIMMGVMYTYTKNLKTR